MARMVASSSGRSVLNWFLVGFPLLGAVLPDAVGVAVYATVGGGSDERPDLDPILAVMGVCNAVPFVAVTLLGRGQLSTVAGHRISSLALILFGGAVALVWPLIARSWWAFLPLLGVLAVGFAAWSADVAVRRAGIIGSGVGVLGLSVQSNAELWRTLFLHLPGFSTWPIGFVFNTIGVLFAGVLVGYLGGVVAYGLVRVASQLRPNAPRPCR